MNLRNRNPVKVTQPVLDGITAVRDSGETNMLDYNQVTVLCFRKGFPEAGWWIGEHKNEYSRGIFAGFEATKP